MNDHRKQSLKQKIKLLSATARKCEVTLPKMTDSELRLVEQAYHKLEEHLQVISNVASKRSQLSNLGKTVIHNEIQAVLQNLNLEVL
ncbi:MAG: hypothetical protein ACOX6V_05510 [Patescibacteria group bacterium]|jgi:hypothetical protein